MGSVGSAISGALGSVGSVIGGGLGSITGGMADAAGINNQFQGQMPAIERQKLLDAITQAQGGQQGITDQQSALAKTLLAQSQGQGPNPALAQLNLNSANAMKQAGAVANSVKGISPALAARLASEQAGGMTQQAAGQAGLMQAQQQLGAQNSLGNLYGQMAGQNLNQQNILQNAQAEQNRAITQGSLGIQDAQARVMAGNAQVRGQLAGGMLSGLGSIGGAMLAAAHGGQIPGEANIPGDHIANDTVPTMLSPGEIVIPRSHAGSPEKAKAFIDHLMKSKMAHGGVVGKYQDDFISHLMGGKAKGC